jgi:hypothetical protein
MRGSRDCEKRYPDSWRIVWAISELASGIQVGRSPQDLAARSPKVLALGFMSHEELRALVHVDVLQSIRWDPRDRRLDTWCLEIEVNIPLNSCISGIHGIGG